MEGIWLSASRVIKSAGSVPTVASSITARSVTVRVRGPAISWVCERGTTPSRLDRPSVPRSPTRLLCIDGIRMDPQVSLPMPAAEKLAAMAAPVPPLEPPGFRDVSYGFRVCPPSELTVVIPRANSWRLVLPRITAPASRNRRTWKASSGGLTLAIAIEPFVVGRPAMS